MAKDYKKFLDDTRTVNNYKDFIKNYKNALKEREDIKNTAKKALEFQKQVEQYVKEQENAPVWTRRSPQEMQQLKDASSKLIQNLRETKLSKDHIKEVNRTIKAGDDFVKAYRGATAINSVSDFVNKFKEQFIEPLTNVIQVTPEGETGKDATQGTQGDIANPAVDNPESAGTNAAATPETKVEDEVTYTYKPGDTFGQVVKDLGLGTKAGLWGPNGDVEYYNKQLEDQLWKSGVWPQGVRQNIPIGTTIKLRRRPEVEG
jgi:ribosomal protein L17